MPDTTPTQPISIVLLGATGSIGTQTLDVVRAMPERFRILGLAAGRNLNTLETQAREFRPRYLWAANDHHAAASRLQAIAQDVGATVCNMDTMAQDPDGHVLVVGTAGRAGPLEHRSALRSAVRLDPVIPLRRRSHLSSIMTALS